MIPVATLENNWKASLIGTKYTHNGLYGQDIITIISKKEGFGMLVHSKITDKEHYMCSHALLRRINYVPS